MMLTLGSVLLISFFVRNVRTKDLTYKEIPVHGRRIRDRVALEDWKALYKFRYLFSNEVPLSLELSTCYSVIIYILKFSPLHY